MKVSRLKIAKLVAERSLKGTQPRKLSRQIAAYLLSEGRVRELDSLLRDIQIDWAEAGHVEVQAVSAHKLSDKVKTDIKRQMKPLYPKAKKVVVSERHDPSVLGGVRLSIASRQLDLTMKTRLNEFQHLSTAGKE